MGEGRELAKEYRDEALRKERMERLQSLEDRLLDRSAAVIEAFLSFHEVDPRQPAPPADWVEAYGAEGAKQRLAIAKAGHLPQSLSPAAVKTATQMYIGITRARGGKGKLLPGNLNVSIINLPAPTSKEHSLPEYEAKEIE